MEFFLPGLAALLIAALIVFLVLPRLGAPILVGLSVALLVFCLYNHYSLFAAEYRYSTWQEQLKWYAPVLMYGGLTVGIIMYLGYLYNNNGANILPASNISTEPNTVVESVINAGKALNNTMTDAVNAFGLNQGKPANQANNSILTNLGNMLNSPRRNNRMGI